MKKLFFVGIKAIITQGDKVLLLKKNDSRQFWDVPGGCINQGEIIEEALRRELAEELPSAINIKLGGILGAHSLTRDIKDNISLTLIFYHVDVTFEGDIRLSDEHNEYEWMTFDRALQVGSEGIPEAIRVLQEKYA